MIYFQLFIRFYSLKFRDYGKTASPHSAYISNQLYNLSVYSSFKTPVAMNPILKTFISFSHPLKPNDKSLVGVLKFAFLPNLQRMMSKRQFSIENVPKAYSYVNFFSVFEEPLPSSYFQSDFSFSQKYSSTVSAFAHYNVYLPL